MGVDSTTQSKRQTSMASGTQGRKRKAEESLDTERSRRNINSANSNYNWRGRHLPEIYPSIVLDLGDPALPMPPTTNIISKGKKKKKKGKDFTGTSLLLHPPEPMLPDESSNIRPRTFKKFQPSAPDYGMMPVPDFEKQMKKILEFNTATDVTLAREITDVLEVIAETEGCQGSKIAMHSVNSPPLSICDPNNMHFGPSDTDHAPPAPPCISVPNYHDHIAIAGYHAVPRTKLQPYLIGVRYIDKILRGKIPSQLLFVSHSRQSIEEEAFKYALPYLLKAELPDMQRPFILGGRAVVTMVESHGDILGLGFLFDYPAYLFPFLTKGGLPEFIVELRPRD